MPKDRSDGQRPDHCDELIASRRAGLRRSGRAVVDDIADLPAPTGSGQTAVGR